MRLGALVPGLMQSLAELSYEFVAGLISDTVGSQGRRYFPLIFTLFMFSLFGNLLGMLPSSFTFTIHIISTLALSLLVFIPMSILATCNPGLHFFTSFVPRGPSIDCRPLLVRFGTFTYLVPPSRFTYTLFS